jgi:hypothetical protein
MYKYEEVKDELFSPEGFQILSGVKKNINRVGFDRFDFSNMTKDIFGDSFQMLAAIDYMEELGYIQCIYKGDQPRQFWLYSRVGE